MKVNWIKSGIEPPKEGKYYVITEAQNDFDLYKKGDIVIAFDRYSKTLGWLSFIVDDSTWKILAWAEILLPDVPEEVKDRLVTYFDTEVKEQEGQMTKTEEMVSKTVHDYWDFCSKIERRENDENN